MAYNRLVISGTVGNGADIWSTGINFSALLGPLVISQADLGLWAEQAATELEGTALGTNLSAGLSANGSITEVRTYYYASNTGPSTFVATSPVTKIGSGTANNPLPTSMVLSLKTPFAGRSFRGRMYWPALSTVVQTGGTFSTSFMSSIATEAANLLNAMSGAAAGTYDLVPAIVSKTRDLVTPVTQVSVGNVPDTQRRRRDALVESYASASI